MDALRLPTGTASALAELETFLHETASPLSAGQAATQALHAWIAAQRHAAGQCAGPARGYQWKCLFLPDGSELRMQYARQDFHARVDGNAILYKGNPVSPREFTLAVAGDGRNAWRDLWIRYPGERSWIRAMVLRRRCQLQAEKQPLSPLDAMREAAACMSETLKNALALVDRANQQALPRFERRLERPRRAIDVSADACRFD